MTRLSSILSGVLVLMLAGLTTPAARAQGVLSFSLARYEITHDGRSERLDLLRTADRIEHRYVTRGITEVWTRNARGELEHSKVFHQANRSVHYTQGDLRTIQLEPAWEQLATLINPAQRARLKTASAKRTAHGPVAVLEGEIDREPARVLWNERSGWAEEMVLGTRARRTKFRLLSTEACSPAACASLDMTQIREIEFADLGDSERDPFVRNFLATFAAHAHAH